MNRENKNECFWKENAIGAPSPEAALLGLRRRAQGFWYCAQEPVKCKKSLFEEGKKVAEEEHVELVTVRHYCPPDPEAARMLLELSAIGEQITLDEELVHYAE